MILISQQTTWRVENIDTVIDVGELAKLATRFGVDAHVENQGDCYDVVFKRYDSDPDERGHSELAHLFILWAYIEGLSGEAGLDKLRQELVRRHLPMDKPLADVMEIGGDPGHDGH